jgi:hypothetical protein
MASERKMILILAMLVATTLIARLIGVQTPSGTWTHRTTWDGFLVGLPELTKSPDQPTMVVFSGITGLLNFLLIAIGGRGFLDVVSHPTPPAGRPPNPPFRFGG